MAHQTRLARWSNCCCMKTEMVVVFTQCHYKRCYFIGHVNHIWPMKTVYFFPLLSSPFPVFVFLMCLSHFSHAATPQCGPSFQSCGLLLHTRTIQGQGRGGRPMAVRRCTLLVLARVNAKDVTDAQARPPWRRSCCAGPVPCQPGGEARPSPPLSTTLSQRLHFWEWEVHHSFGVSQLAWTYWALCTLTLGVDVGC